MLTDLLAEAIKGAFAGALIGYATNELAIWMLFHPSRPVRVLGMRLPFTPGLIVKNKARLAEAVGKSVARDLIDPQRLAEHLEEIRLHEVVTSVLQKEYDRLAATESPLSEVLGPEVQPGLRALLDRVATQLAAEARSAARKALEPDADVHAATLAPMLNGILEQPLKHWIPAEQQPRLAALVIEQLEVFTSSAAMKDFLSVTVKSSLRSLPDSEAFKVLETAGRSYLEGRLPALVVSLQDSMADFLDGEDFARLAQGPLANRLHEMLVAKFPVAKMMVQASVVEELLRQRWDEIISELRDLIMSEPVNRLLEEQLQTGADNLFEVLRETLEDDAVGESAGSYVVVRAREAIAEFLKSDSAKGAISGILDNLLAKSPAELAGGADALRKGLVTALLPKVRERVDSDESENWLREKLNARMEELCFQKPVKEVVALVPKKDWTSTSTFLGRFVEKHVIKLVPVLLRERVNLAQLVMRRVEEFEAKQLEATIKRVSGKELRGIVRLGGVIGLVVGAIAQVLFFLMK